MKLLYIISLLLLGSLVGCETEKPDMFVDTHFIKFLFNAPGEKEYYRIDYNFSHGSDDANEYMLSVPIEIKGRDLARDLYFGITVDEEKTTLPADCFVLEREQVFRTGFGNIDSMRVKLLRKPLLKDGALMLRLCLAQSNDMQLYMLDSSFVEIHVEDVFMRPAWWNKEVEKAYLGTFSEKKYSLFKKETGVFDFESLSASEKRYYSIMFKRFLEKAVPPLKEENGSPMTVTIAG